MPTLDVYVYATKRDDKDQLIAHAGWVREDVTRAGRLLPGAYAMKVGRLRFGTVVEGLDGMDPSNVDVAKLEASLDPGQRRVAYQFLVDLRLALEHSARVRVMRRPSVEQRTEDSDGGTVVADLYDNVRIVIKKDGQALT